MNRWRSFVAIGDSFTEGLDDPDPISGAYRGWADLVADCLAAGAPQQPPPTATVGDGTADHTFGYANLAIRGRLLDAVLTEQLPVALRMRPDLVSLAAGGNDVLRRRCDPYALVARFEAAVGELRAAGSDVLLFRFADLSGRLPIRRVIADRVAILNRAAGEIAERHGAILVDLWTDRAFANPLLWSADRLHLSTLGHHRVAGHVLAALGVSCDPAWLEVRPLPAPVSWWSARGTDLRWVRRHLAPWLSRRLTGRSSGDTVVAKRPALAPVVSPLTSDTDGSAVS